MTTWKKKKKKKYPELRHTTQLLYQTIIRKLPTDRRWFGDTIVLDNKSKRSKACKRPKKL